MYLIYLQSGPKSYPHAMAFSAEVSNSVEASIREQQEQGKTLALIATRVRSNWAMQICEMNDSRSLGWTSELDEGGQETGELSCKCL